MDKSCAVVIFNFIDFDIHEKLQRREESENDVKELENLFYLVGASIYLVNNPSIQEFNKEIETLSKFDFSNFGTIILIFMSHGDEKNILYCKDGQFNFMEESQKVFRNPKLSKKPKFIIVEACKGEFDIDLDPYDGSEDGSDDSGITAVLTSSFEGFVSKLGDEGTIFIKKFSEVVRKSWKKQQAFTETLKQFIVEFNNPDYQIEQTATLNLRYGVESDNADYSLPYE